MGIYMIRGTPLRKFEAYGLWAPYGKALLHTLPAQRWTMQPQRRGR